MKTPTPGEFLEFLRGDGGWTLVRGTKHGHYEKTLPDGTVLSTHTSWGRKKILSPDTFKLILSTQLAVTEDQFWSTIKKKAGQRTTVVVSPANPDPLASRVGRSSEGVIQCCSPRKYRVYGMRKSAPCIRTNCMPSQPAG